MFQKHLFKIIVLMALGACSGQYADDKTQLYNNAVAPQAINSSGHWLTAKQLFIFGQVDPNKRHYLQANELSAAGNHQRFLLENTVISDEIAAKFPHLVNNGTAFKLATAVTNNQIKQLLKQRLTIISADQNGLISRSVNVQIGNVIDDLYGAKAGQIKDLGASINADNTQFKLWAPTALKVEVLLFNADKSRHPLHTVALSEDLSSGLWSTSLTENLFGQYYQYKIQVFHPSSSKIETVITTDPYSLSLSVNGEYSQVTDLNDSRTQPQGWQQQAFPTVDSFEDNIFYELHIRDFSASDSKLDSKVKGKYKAFLANDSFAMEHLKQLKAAGLNNIHLLPAFDFGTVNEEAKQQLSLQDDVAKLCDIYSEHQLCSQAIAKQTRLIDLLNSYQPDSAQAQQLVSQLRPYDDYNWGYDPFHYTVPEGSYAQDPEGNARIIEFRQMVQRLHNLGFRVIMDVVYNHTHQAGLHKNSVLDKIVPGYYQRLNPITAAIEQSTCCDNTATERVMMAKLMIDSLLVWAGDYHIDGFRFDLMAHQPKAVMLAARAAVLEVDADNYFYGEGWNFGEVQNNQRFVQASQLELAGSEIGTFSDRLRDAVRGGGMTEAGEQIRRLQGIGNGLFTDPNELRTGQDSWQDYLLLADQLRVGLAANLATFPLENSQGQQVTGKDIPYGDQPTGYALDPADTINYVSKHDNKTLWDNNQYRFDANLTTDDRVRLQTLSLAYPLLAQGIPFLHMGSELLRSKSFLRDSYDYGDWFNKVDFSKQSNNYANGLPPAEKDEQNWSVIGKIIAANQGRDRVSGEHIQFSSDRFIELIKIRMSSKLFRLTTGEAINHGVTFLNTGPKQQPGLIVMSINAAAAGMADSKFKQIIVVFNSSKTTQTFPYLGAENYQLHEVQATSQDKIIKQSKAAKSGFTVAKFSAAVFVKSDIN